MKGEHEFSRQIESVDLMRYGLGCGIRGAGRRRASEGRVVEVA